MSAEPGVLIAGEQERPAAAAPAAPSRPRKPRLKRVDREQMVWRAIDPERLVDEDHPARAIWDFLGALDLSRFCAGLPAIEGRPGRDRSDPRVVIALWLYALCRGVREARALAEGAQYEPGCQWLLGLGRINYHTLADFVTAHAAALDELFVQVVQVLMNEKLVDLERVAHDGTKIRAAASRSSFKRPQRLAECRRLAEEHLAALQQQSEEELSAARRKAQQRAARERLERMRRAQQELERQQAEKAAAEQEKRRARVTDPDARIMRQGDGGFAPSYHPQISTDSRAGVIVAYEVSQAKEDSGELQPAVERIGKNTGQTPQQVLVDGGYTTRKNLMEMPEGAPELIGSLGENRSQNKQTRHGVSPEFLSERFAFDATRNRYTCPAGKFLTYKSRKKLAGATEKHYRAQPGDCQGCPFRAQCCPKAKQGRLVIQTEEHPQVAAFRKKMQGDEYRAIYRQRGPVAEFSNACLKEKRGLRKYLRRGLAQVRAETAWACLSCNVAIWIRRVWKPRRRAAA
jgi:transposase